MWLNNLLQFSLIAVAVTVGGAAVPFVRVFLERLVGHQFDRRLEEIRDGSRIRDEAAKVAEYFALHLELSSTDDKATYHRVNQLGWELALYLPTDVYRHVRDAVFRPTLDRNQLTALMAVRQHLLGNQAGDLGPDDIAIHTPNAGSLPSAAQSTPPIVSA